MFPREPQGEVYPDLYEELAGKKYSVESVFGTSPSTKTRGAGVEPTQRSQPSFQANRSPARRRAEPNFTVEVKKTRKFVRPGEEAAPQAAPNPENPHSYFTKPRF